MRRFTALVLLVVALVTGATIGVLGRSWLDGQHTSSQAGLEPVAPVAAATSASAVSAAVPDAPSAPPTIAPTLVPTVATAARVPRPTAAPTATAATRDMVVEVSESDLQTHLSDMLVGRSLGTTPLGDATIQSVTVALRDRQVSVGGAARAAFFNAPFTAHGTVSPDANGRPLVSVNQATVGGALLPDGARTALSDVLQTQVDGLFADRAMKVRTIDITDGTMRLVGTAGS